MAEHKLLGIIVAAGLCIVGAIFAFIEYTSSKPEQSLGTTVDVATPDTGETTKSELEQYSGPLTKTEFSGKVLVSKRPVKVLASPAATATPLYGFPAGRPFQVLGGDGGDYLKIKDLQSGASGWIEQAALAPAPTAPPPTARTSGSGNRKATAGSQRRSTSGSDTAIAEPKPAPKEKRKGLFGGGGVFGGLFGGR